MLRVGIVANEMSGDLLGAGLMRALREQVQGEVLFEGVGGPRMIEEGCVSLYPLERLSVMGFVEVWRHLPELLSIRRALVRHFLAEPPDICIGIDAPDFNLGWESKTKAAGIPTAHYVSPTVWAWRSGRVRKIRKAVDLLLCILPFEADFLEKHGVPASYVGHSLADEIPLENDRDAARKRLGIHTEGAVVALLPGSRLSEIHALSKSFIEAAGWCHERRSELRFISPMASPAIREAFEAQLRSISSGLPIQCFDGEARDVIIAADVVLTASGTATFECLLSGRPMVVGYRMHRLTYRLLKGLNLVKVPHIAMANLLAGEALAPEFVQDECTPEKLGEALMAFLDAPDRITAVQERYRRIHQEMRRDSSRRAAEAVLGLIKDRLRLTVDS